MFNQFAKRNETFIVRLINTGGTSGQNLTRLRRKLNKGKESETNDDDASFSKTTWHIKCFLPSVIVTIFLSFDCSGISDEVSISEPFPSFILIVRESHTHA